MKSIHILIIALISLVNCSPLKNDNQMEKPYTAHSSQLHKQLKKDGYSINYFVYGDPNNDALILLHPAFSDHKAFEYQIDYFSKSYCVITVDLIGHGLSKVQKSKDQIDQSALHIAEILQKEGFESCHLLGVSMGSLVAQHFGITYPEKTKSLTALGGYNINEKNDKIAKAQQSSNMKLIIKAIFSMDAFRKATASISTHTPQGAALFIESSKQYRRKSFMVMQGFENIIQDRVINEHPYPTLILSGEHDIPLALEMAEDWHKKIENSEFKIIKGAGHCANMDCPETFNNLLNNFLNQYSAIK